MDFSNKGYGRIPLPFFDGKFIIFNDTIFSTIVIGTALIILSIIVRVKLKKFKEVPETPFQNIVELAVESMHNFTVSNMSEKYAYFGNWFFGLFVFIICSNLSGLIGLRPPTADLATTLSFGITTVFLIHFMGITKSKADYFKGYLDPIFFFLPINIVSEAAPLISLSFRMFGNIFGGLVIMGLFYGLVPWFLQIGIPSVLHAYFDVFGAAIQTLIFVMLSMIFIRNKMPD